MHVFRKTCIPVPQNEMTGDVATIPNHKKLDLLMITGHPGSVTKIGSRHPTFKAFNFMAVTSLYVMII